MFKKITALHLILLLSLAASAAMPTMTLAAAANATDVSNALNKTAAYVYGAVKNPQVGSIGGEWAVIGLARSGYSVPETYYEAYKKTAEAYVREHSGVLHDKKYTEYSRVILGLTAAGYDPRNAAGYDLTKPLGDFDNTIWQGINGPVFALIALDSGDYPIPENSGAKTQATRDMYINEILRRQLPDGGFNLTAGADGSIGSNERVDPDITGMTLQALAKYQDKTKVKDAVNKALDCLSKLQDASGGYDYSGDVSSESVVQVIVALCELGVKTDDPRFVKNGKTLLDNLLSFQNSDGSFRHTSGGSGDSMMATEQALYGLASLHRAASGQSSLYRMGAGGKTSAPASSTPAPGVTTAPSPTPKPSQAGISGKAADVKVVPETTPGKTFADIQGHANQKAINALAARGIIGGKSESAFDPNGTMTRAEFATIVTRGLGLAEKKTTVFADVQADAWYAGYVGAAYSYGIVSGVSNTEFKPDGLITRQEAAVMITRAAKLCGMDTAVEATEAHDILAQFGDYVTASDWARSGLAFCYREKILSDETLDIQPAVSVKRCEVAEMLHRTLIAANLLP